MTIKKNVNWKFKVNGKEYGSVEEMPGPIREAYEKTVREIHGFPCHREVRKRLFRRRRFHLEI